MEPADLQRRIELEFEEDHYEEGQLDAEQTLGLARTPIPGDDLD